MMDSGSAAQQAQAAPPRNARRENRFRILLSEHILQSDLDDSVPVPPKTCRRLRLQPAIPGVGDVAEGDPRLKWLTAGDHAGSRPWAGTRKPQMGCHWTKPQDPA